MKLSIDTQARLVKLGLLLFIAYAFMRWAYFGARGTEVTVQFYIMIAWGIIAFVLEARRDHAR